MKLLPLLLCFLVSMSASSFAQQKEPVPLLRGHAHNDYYHKRPLLDALELGYCSVEADVHLQDGHLLVAHTFFEIKKTDTLQRLYLKPLFERIRSNGGSVHKTPSRFFLLIDFKSSGSESLKQLEALLKPHAALLTRLENGKVVQGAMTVIISGNRPAKEIAVARDRLVFLDGRLSDPVSWGKDISPIISESWNSHFKYRGFREMDRTEQTKLLRMVTAAHREKKFIRFWALPDRSKGWEAAYHAGVDLINTDKLAELRALIQSKQPASKQPASKQPASKQSASE